MRSPPREHDRTEAKMEKDNAGDVYSDLLNLGPNAMEDPLGMGGIYGMGEVGPNPVSDDVAGLEKWLIENSNARHGHSYPVGLSTEGMSGNSAEPYLPSAAGWSHGPPGSNYGPEQVRGGAARQHQEMASTSRYGAGGAGSGYPMMSSYRPVYPQQQQQVPMGAMAQPPFGMPNFQLDAGPLGNLGPPASMMGGMEGAYHMGGDDRRMSPYMAGTSMASPDMLPPQTAAKKTKKKRAAGGGGRGKKGSEPYAAVGTKAEDEEIQRIAMGMASNAMGMPGISGDFPASQMLGGQGGANEGPAVLPGNGDSTQNLDKHSRAMLGQLLRVIGMLDLSTRKTISDSMQRLATTKAKVSAHQTASSKANKSAGGTAKQQQDMDEETRAIDRSVCQLLFNNRQFGNK